MFAEHQISSVVSVEMREDFLRHVPKPLYVLNYQSGVVCAEYPRTDEVAVALRLCGLGLSDCRQITEFRGG